MQEIIELLEQSPYYESKVYYAMYDFTVQKIVHDYPKDKVEALPQGYCNVTLQDNALTVKTNISQSFADYELLRRLDFS